MCVLTVLDGIFHWLKSSCKVNLDISDSIYDVAGSSIFLLKFYHFLPQRNNQRQVFFFHIKRMLFFFKETDREVITSVGKTCPGKVHISLYFTFFFFFFSLLSTWYSQSVCLHDILIYSGKMSELFSGATTQWQFYQSFQIPLVFFSRALAQFYRCQKTNLESREE